MLKVMFSEDGRNYFGKVSIFNYILSLFSMMRRNPLDWRYIRIHRLNKNSTEFYNDYKYILWRADRVKFVPKDWTLDQAVHYEIF
jgi:hypothetical protein